MGQILVTGAQGYVGRYVVSALLEADHNVVGVGRSPKNNDHFTHAFDFHGAKRPAPLPASIRRRLSNERRYVYERCNLVDTKAVSTLINKLQPSIVIHLAGALRDEKWPSLVSLNLVATLNIMMASSVLNNRPLIVLGSTGSIYGDQAILPIGETAAPAPVGSYAVSKSMSEMMAVNIAQDQGIQLIIARIFNILGPGLQPRHFCGYLVHRIAEIEKLNLSPEIAVGDLNTVRDFVDVRDIAQFFACDLRQYEAIAPVNVAWGTGIEMKTIADYLVDKSSKPIKFKSNPLRNRPGALRIFSSTDKFRKVYTPQFTVEQSLADMLNYARDAIA